MVRYLCAALLLLALLLAAQCESPQQGKQITQQAPLEVKEVFEQVIRQSTDDSELTESSQSTTEHLQGQCANLTECAARQALFERYLSYKARLAQLMLEYGSLSFEEQFLMMREQQHALFTKQEQSLLFANDNTWNDYMLARLQISQDSSLNAAQKQALNEQLLEQQPQQLREAYQNTAQLTLASDKSLSYNQLAAQLGSETASKLEVLNQQESRWLARIEKAKARLASLSDSHAKQNYLEAHFSASERKRLAVYLD